VLIVAVHDVAPSTLDQVGWLLAELDAMGLSRRVLKVVPAEPGASEAGQAALAELVAREAAAGSEIVLHGWTHRAAGPLRGSPVDNWRARLFAGESAEFLTIDEAEMRVRLDDGVSRLGAWGATAVGFCPPAWLAGRGATAAARGAGLRYVVTIRGLRDLTRERWITLPPVGYMGAGATQEALVGMGELLLSRPLRALLGRDVHRIFLHPQGAPGSAACRRILGRIADLAPDHPAGTYRELLRA
jgi:uncharacterized protein